MADSFEIATGHVTIDTKFDGRRVRRVSYREGHGAGSSFYHGFRRGSLYRFNKLWKTFFKPLNNLKKWLTRLRIPAILGGIVGSALALVPTLAQLGSVVGVGMLPAFLSWASTIGIVRALLGDLSKSIKSQVMKQLNAASEGFKKLAVETAKPGLNAFLEEALTHTPILNKYVKDLAKSVSQVGYAMVDVLNRQQNIDRIKVTLNDTAKATGIWYSLLDDAAEVLIALASSGAPLFLRFTRSMERVGKSVHDWIMLQKATGALDRYLGNAYNTLEKFGRGGRDFLIGLFNIINGGVFGTERVADSFERWGASFRKWSQDSENVARVRDTIAWFVDHVDEFFRFAAAATAVQLALTQISKIKAMALFVRTLIGLGPVGFVLFGIGAALSSLMGGFVLAYTHSERFRKKLYELFGMIKTRLGPVIADWWKWLKDELAPVLEELAVEGIGRLKDSISGLLDTVDDNKEALKEWRPVILFLVKALSYLTGFAIKGLIEELGGLITIVGWVGRGIGMLRRLFTNLPGWIGTAVDAVAGYFRAFKDTIGDSISAVAGYFHRLKDRVGEVVDNTAAAFRALPGKVTRFLKSLPGALVRSLELALEGAVIAVAYGLGTIVEYFVRLPGRVVGAMDLLWDLVWGSVEHGIGVTVNFFALLPGRVMRWMDRTWDSAYASTVRGWNTIVGFIAGLPERIGSWIIKTWLSVLNLSERWIPKIVAFIGGLPGLAAAALVSLVPKIVSRFTDAWSGSQRTSGTLVAKIITFIGGVAARAWKALVQLKDRLVNRFAEGWSAATGTSKAKVVALINMILGIPGRAFNALRGLAGQLKSRASSGWQAFRDAAADKVVSFIVFVSQIPGRVVKGLGAIGTKLRESGRQLLQGLLVGVQARISEIGGLGGWFKKNLVDPVVGAVKRFFGIASPSRVFHGIGTNIVAGLWKGIASHNPMKMITKIFGGMPEALASMLQKGLVNVSSLPQKALKALGSLWGAIGDLFGGGGRGGPGTGGTIGFAAQAWRMLQGAFGLPMGGYRAHGSVPGSDHPKGKAIDVMTNSPSMHEMIIAFARATLPGLKYWISNRQIASADHGWTRRPYHGPSPHTDHVHLSFFRQGRNRLPEDILGFGKSGRGYVMHRGEQVLRRNQTTIGHQGAVNHYHFGPNSVVLDASSIRDLNDVVDLIKGLQSTVRMHGVSGTQRVA